MNVQEDTKPEVEKVFQGKFMREDASLFSKMTFSYPKPLLDQAMKGEICFEQYGELSEDLKIKEKVVEF